MEFRPDRADHPDGFCGVGWEPVIFSPDYPTKYPVGGAGNSPHQRHFPDLRIFFVLHPN